MKHSYFPATVMMSLCMAGCSSVAERPRPASNVSGAVAMLFDAEGRNHGHASLVEVPGGILLDVRAEGLPPGQHGVHVHAIGSCAAPDFASAGGHWNPQGREHGSDNAMGPHMGDLPNLVVDSSGTARLKALLPGGHLRRGDNPLLDADGAALIVHADKDDMKTNPSGNSGARTLCGVIKSG